jgi:hypothetical protein
LGQNVERRRLIAWQFAAKKKFHKEPPQGDTENQARCERLSGAILLRVVSLWYVFLQVYERVLHDARETFASVAVKEVGNSGKIVAGTAKRVRIYFCPAKILEKAA